MENKNKCGKMNIEKVKQKTKPMIKSFGLLLPLVTSLLLLNYGCNKNMVTKKKEAPRMTITINGKPVSILDVPQAQLTPIPEEIKKKILEEKEKKGEKNIMPMR